METVNVNGKKYFPILHTTTLESGSACKHCVADADDELCAVLNNSCHSPNRYYIEEKQVMQVGGTHYADMPIQPLEIMKANFKEAEYEGYLRGNVLKYLLRYQTKNGVEDLKKAEHYLTELIGYLEV
jgi:hypothetical protein